MITRLVRAIVFATLGLTSLLVASWRVWEGDYYGGGIALIIGYYIDIKYDIIKLKEDR